MDLDIYLPDNTCAVAQQLFISQLNNNPARLFRSDPDLAAAVWAVTASHKLVPNSRLQNLQAAIQNSGNAILRAISITAEQVDAVQHLPGSEYSDSTSGDDGDAGAGSFTPSGYDALFDGSPTADDWMWDPTLRSTGYYMNSDISMWAAAVSVFGVSLVMGGLVLLQRGLAVLAQRRAEHRMVRDVMRGGEEARVEEGGVRQTAELAASRVGLLWV